MDSKEKQIDEYFDSFASHLAQAPGNFLRDKRHFILDENKNVVPVNFADHTRFMCKCDTDVPGFNRIVKQEEIGDASISTVFSGISKHEIFETLVSQGGRNREFRWKTWKEAEEGHEEVCKMIRAGD